MTDVRVNVQLVLRLEHDGPTEGLGKIKYDGLLAGAKLVDPQFGGKLSDALEEGLLLTDNEVGRVDEDVSYRIGDIRELVLMQVVEVVDQLC